MRVERQLRLNQGADRLDLARRNLRRTAIERHKRNSAIRTQRVVVSLHAQVHEQVVLEKGLLHNLVPVTPPSPHFVDRQKGFNGAYGQLLVNLTFMSRTSVKGIPHSFRLAFGLSTFGKTVRVAKSPPWRR